MKLITVGKLKDKALTALVDEYVKRLKPYEKVEILEIGRASCRERV